MYPVTLSSLLCASLLFAAAAVPAASAPLAAERWNKRIVVAFADAPNGEIRQQVDVLLADREALAEREMLVIEVAGASVSAPFGTLPANLSANELRDAYQIAPGTPFAVILVGKDGGEKLRRSMPVSAREIFGLIDSMPMRRSEASGG